MGVCEPKNLMTTKPSTTLTQCWREYRDRVYPKDMPADQNRECHQAFMAGAYTALIEVGRISNCPDTDEAESQAANKIGELIREAEQWINHRSIALNSPRN